MEGKFPKMFDLIRARVWTLKLLSIFAQRAKTIPPRKIDGDYAKKHDWAKEVDLSEVINAIFRDKARKMLRIYFEMWYGELGRITATENMILLKQGARSVHQMPYR